MQVWLSPVLKYLYGILHKNNIILKAGLYQ